MAWTLVDSDAVGFTDAAPGFVYTVPAGAPGANDLDILCANGNNSLFPAPSGFTERIDATQNQGAYIWSRLGGSGTTITLTSNIDDNYCLIWMRFTGSNAYSTGNYTQANNSNATVLPATTTGVLAASNMLIVSFGALHDFDGALATSPVWSNGFTDLGNASQGASGGATSVAAMAGYKIGGTASETTSSVSWTNNARNRYALWVAFTGAADAYVRPKIVTPRAAPGRARSR